MYSLLQAPIKNFLHLSKHSYLTVSPEIIFGEIVELFKEKGQNFAIFLKDGRPVGILTERDILRALLQGYPLEKPAFYLAKKELIKVRCSDTLLQAFNLMTENFIRRLIVIDEKGEFVGVLAQQDLILYSTEELFKGEGKIRDLLDFKGELIYAHKEELLKSILEKMAKYNIGAIPILDETKKPIGIITERDFIKVDIKDLEKPAKEIALKEVITIKYNEPIVKGIKLFKDYKIRHLIVVDNEGCAINILSQRDFIQSLACTYTDFLERHLQQAKNFISLLPEIVIELSECDSECKITWMNDFAKKNLGEEYLEKDIYTLLDIDEWNRIYGKLKRERFIYKEKIASRRGSYFEVTGTYLEFGKKEGKIKLFLRDITHEILEEERLKKEIRFLKNFLDNSLDFIFVIDKEGKIYYANTAFKKALGYAEEEIMTKTIFDIVALPRGELEKNIELLIKKGLEIKGRRFYKDCHQNLIPVEIKAKATLLNGEPFIIINARDIRELVLTEDLQKREIENLFSFYNFINELNLAQDEEKLWQTLESHVLKKVETLQYFEIDPTLREIKATFFGGNKELIGCSLEKEVNECRVFRTGKIFVKREDSYCPLFLKKDLSYFCLPLIFEGRIQGLINLVKRTSFYEEEIRYLEEKLHVFNIYFNQLRLLKIYKEQSIRDPFLNIYNRRFLLEILKKEEEKAKRDQGFLSIIIMDLDHFKKINDTFGHLAGDEVLRQISLLISLSVREMDYFGRWGGEEFLILLPKTSKEEAFLVAERLRSKIESHEIYTSEGFKIKVTGSFGVAEYPRDALSIEGLIKKADERLYQAKLFGRNRVVAEG
ncbi:MAG: diguanylate cyclase [Caldimicrobium sp.]